ncbi:MAG: hypothetical protein HQ517_08310, partial [SAR324 cluster bacterium]|nr:hypothetical protein [SAR324 cluster bacterium]
MLCCTPILAQKEPNTLVDASQQKADLAIVSGQGEITQTTVRQERQQIAENKSLTPEQQTRILDLYDQALTQLEKTGLLKTQQQRFETLRESAPQELVAKREALKRGSETKPMPDTDRSVKEIEQSLTVAKRLLQQAQQTGSELEKEPKLRADRRSEIPNLSSTDQQELAKINQQLNAPASTTDSPVFLHATRVFQLARKRLLQ